MDDSDTLTANTGKNDPSSVWGSGLLTNFVDIAKQGAGIYNLVRGGTATGNTGVAGPGPVQPAAMPPSGVNWKQYLPWAIGAVALIVVAGLLFRRR